MRAHGTLSKWNEDRGFGFVTIPHSHEEIFVHISAFPRDGVRPRIGESISFEIGVAPDGRKRAEAVQRPAARKPPVQRATSGSARGRGWFAPLLSGAVLLVIGYSAYNAYVSRQQNQAEGSAAPVAKIHAPAVRAAAPSFTCDGRTHCSQMRSCAEARYFLNHCPNVQMDGDSDGVPCEDQWCRWP